MNKLDTDVRTRVVSCLVEGKQHSRHRPYDRGLQKTLLLNFSAILDAPAPIIRTKYFVT